MPKTYYIINATSRAVANLTRTNNHNLRLIQPINADPGLAHTNIISGDGSQNICEQAYRSHDVQHWSLAKQHPAAEVVLSLIPCNYDGTEVDGRKVAFSALDFDTAIRSWIKSSHIFAHMIPLSLSTHNDESLIHTHFVFVPLSPNLKTPRTNVYNTNTKKNELRMSAYQHLTRVFKKLEIVDSPLVTGARVITLAQRRTGLRPFAHCELNKASICIHLLNKYGPSMDMEATRIESEALRLNNEIEMIFKKRDQQQNEKFKSGPIKPMNWEQKKENEGPDMNDLLDF